MTDGFLVWIIWGFPTIRGTILGVPIIRTIVFWGLNWGPLNFGNHHIGYIGIMEKKMEITTMGYVGLRV